MEIGPISGIRPVPAVKSPPSDPHLPAVFDIEHSSAPDDDTYSGSQSAAGGEDEHDETKEAEQAEQSESLIEPSSSIDLIA